MAGMVPSVVDLLAAATVPSVVVMVALAAVMVASVVATVFAAGTGSHSGAAGMSRPAGRWPRLVSCV